MDWPWSKHGGEDIQLPNESGRRDPRLPKPPPSVGDALSKAGQGYQDLSKRLEEMKREALLRKMKGGD